MGSGRSPHLLSFATAALLGLAASSLTGCAPATFNVRASRAYSNEEASVPVVQDRIDDLVAVRAHLEELLAATPYSPGDPWITALELRGPEADRLRASLAARPPYAGGDFEVPIVKLYRLHLESVLKQASAPRPVPARHPSLLDGVGELAPGARGLKQAWAIFDTAVRARIGAAQEEQRIREAFEQSIRLLAARPPDPPRLLAARAAVAGATLAEDQARAALAGSIAALAAADIGAPRPARTAWDALTALSVALRVELEGLALCPTVITQAIRAQQIAGRDLPFFREGTSGQGDLPSRARTLELRGRAELPVLEQITGILSAKTGFSREQTAGFVLRQSIVDQIVGVQLDSLRVHTRLDGEVMFYNQLGTSGVSGDYTGRTRRLEYGVEPVAMVGGRIMLAFDWLHLQNAATLNGAFTTDRLFSTNGSITSSGSLGERLGLRGPVSDVVDIGVGLLGIRTRLKNATFTAGEAREIGVDPATGRDTGLLGRAPLQLSYTQLDIGYDIAFLMSELAAKYWIEETVVGFRYMSYRLPRIMYELKDTMPPGSSNQNFAFDRESPAQDLGSSYYMGGATLRFGQGEGRVLSLFGDLGLYGGAGPTSYYFLADRGAPDVPANRVQRSPAALVFDVAAGLGGRVRLTPKKSRFRLLLEGQYHAEAITQTILTELRETRTKDGSTFTVSKKVDFGGTDIFHGPRLQLVGVF